MLLLGNLGVVYAANDVVITMNGDRLVGEIKKAEKDVLTLSTDLFGFGLEAVSGRRVDGHPHSEAGV